MLHTISLIAPRGNVISIKAAGSGPALILLHGFPLDHRMWLEQLSGLSEHFHVIAPDLRGFGQSTLTDSPYTMKELADDVEFIRKHLAGEQPLRLCGLSFGGYIAFEYWQHYRQNLELLVLANTKPTADDEAARAGRLKMAADAVELGAWPAVEGMFPKLLSAVTREQQPAVAASVEAMMRSAPAAGIAAAQQAMAARRDFTAALATMQTPTLVITGADDPIAPPAATEAWAKRIPGARYACLAEAGHLTPLEQPAKFNGLVLGGE